MKIQKKNWGLVILLMICYTFSFIDRYIINLLVEPMKRDLDFSDTQISFLLGASFAVLYSIMGIPFGIWADTKHRGKLVAIGISIWSIATTSLTFLRTFPMMFLGRVGVGIGEASLTPSAYSLISDRFEKEKVPTALSVYSLGIYVGIAIAYIGGGALIGYLQRQAPLQFFNMNIYPWQLTFAIVGLPGLLLAVMVKAYIKDERKETKSTRIAFSLKTIGRKTRLALTGFACLSIAVYGSGVWIPAFLQRVFQLPVETVGQITGVGLVVLPAIGLFLGTAINKLLSRKRSNNTSLLACFIISLMFLPFAGTYGLFNNLNWSLVFFIPYGLTVSAIVGVGASCIQELASQGQKGLLTGIYVLVQNLVGYGLGPTLIGMMTDHIFQDEMQLGKSILVVCTIAAAFAATFFYLSFKTQNNE